MNLLRKCIDVVAVTRRRNRAAKAFKQLSLMGRAIFWQNFDAARLTFTAEFSRHDIGVLQYYGFTEYTEAPLIMVGRNVQGEFKMTALTIDLLASRRKELS